MTTTPDRVRRAINATAEQITDGSIPPLQLPEPARQFTGRSRPDARGWPRWMAPAAAAASMAVIAAAALVISPVVRYSEAGPLTGVPTYYAALDIKTPIGHRPGVIDLTIRSTATGEVLATEPSPAHLVFFTVTAAADDRTFVAAAGPTLIGNASHPVRFYLLRFRSATDTISVTELPIRDVVDDGQISIAVSPNGRHLAVAASHEIRVYSVPSGAEQSWTNSPPVPIIGPPAWVGDSRYLAYYIFARPSQPPLPWGMYLLDTASRNRRLLQASRPVAGVRQSDCAPDYFIPQRSLVVCTTVYGRGAKAYVTDKSLRTGKVLRRFPLPALVDSHTANPGLGLAWASRDGTRAIVLMAVATGPKAPDGVTPTVARAFVVTSDGITRLPGESWPSDWLLLIQAVAW